MKKTLLLLFISLLSIYNIQAVNGNDEIDLPIAYIDTDSVILNYEYAKNANDLLLKKYEESKATLDNEYKNLKKEEEEFKRKINDNAFLTAERAEQEMKRIQKLSDDLQEKANKLGEEFAHEQQIHNEQLTNNIKIYLKEYNQTKNYHFIFTNTGIDNILFAKEKYNITNDFLQFLNNKYKLLSKK